MDDKRKKYYINYRNKEQKADFFELWDFFQLNLNQNNTKEQAFEQWKLLNKFVSIKNIPQLNNQ